MVRFLAVALVAVFTLSACSQESPNSAATDVSFDQPLTFNGLTPVARSFTLAPQTSEELGFSGAFLYVDADEENTTANNWRFRLAVASNVAPIQQTYIDVRNAGDDLSYGIFELCDPSCNANSIRGWVSGLNPRDIGVEEGESFTLRLVVEDTNNTAQVVATTTLTWAPMSLTAPNIGLSGNVLTAQWEGIEQTDPNALLRYNLYAVEGLYLSRSAAFEAETNQWQRRLIDGTNTSLNVNANAVTVWVTAVNASGEIAFSNVALLNTTPPAAPTIALVQDTGSATGITSNGAFTVSGIAAGTTVEYSINGGNSWSTTVPTAVEGANNISVRQTDVAGNVSPSGVLEFTLDTAVPVAPSIAFVEDTGTVAGLTSNGAFTVGNIEVGATVEYSTDGGNTWSTNLPFAVEGANTIRVRQIDGAGNTSPFSNLAFTLDTIAPAAPGISLTQDTGSVTGVTSNGAFTVNGIEVNAIVQYSTDGGDTWLTDIPEAVVGENTIRVRQIDGAGNVSASGLLTFTLDTVTPLALFSAATFNVNTSTPLITGTVDDASADVTINVNDVYYTAPADGLTWSILVDTPLADGTYPMTVFAVDAAGNTSGVFDAQLLVDTTPPILAFSDFVDDEFLTHNAALVITGTVSELADISVTLAGEDYLITNAESLWTLDLAALDVTLTNGEYPITAQATDSAGNTSALLTGTVIINNNPPDIFVVDAVVNAANETSVFISGVLYSPEDELDFISVTLFEGEPEEVQLGNAVVESGSWSLEVDFSALAIADGDYPAALTLRARSLYGITTVMTGNLLIDTELPVSPSIFLVEDTGSVTGVTSNGAFTVSNIEDGAELEYSADGGDNWSSLEPVAVEGENEIYVRQKDVAGNTSPNGELVFTLDTIPPSIAFSDFVDDEFLTHNAALVITGTVSELADISITLAGEDYLITNAESLWTLDLAALAVTLTNGEYPITAQATDSAGNTSALLTGTVIINNNPPDIFVDNTVVNAANETSVFISGFLYSPEDELDFISVTLFEGEPEEVQLGNAVVESGSWSLEVDFSALAIADGEYPAALTLRARSLYGITTIMTGNLLIDTVALAPTITLVEDTGSVTGITSNGAFTVGNIEDGAMVEYSADGGNTWFTATPEAVEGENEIYVRQTDIAGNTSPSGELVFTLDTVPPTVTIEELYTNTLTPVISGSVSEAATITLQIGDDFIAFSANGGWTLDLATEDVSLSNGPNEIFAFATDQAGNEGEETSANVFVNTVAPELTINPVVVNSQNYLSFSTQGTTNVLEEDVSSIVVRLFPDTDDEINIPSPFVSDYEWAAMLVEWPLPDDGTYVNGLEVTLTTLYGSAITVFEDVIVQTTLPSNESVFFTLDPVTADNIINYNESSENITISGEISGAVSVGDEVEISIDGGEPYFTELNASLGFSIEVPGYELAYATAPSISVRVFANDAFGNPETPVDSEDFFYDVDLVAPEITLNTFAITSLDPNLAGTVSEPANVTVELSKTGETSPDPLVTAASTNWSFNVSGLNLAIGEWDVQITATDTAGNVEMFFGSVDVIGDPVANNETYHWLWDGYSTIEVPAAQGVLANDTDPQGLSLEVVLLTVLDGNEASFEMLSDGSFSYEPDLNDEILVVEYEIFNSYTYDTATLTLNIRRIEDEAAQACLFVPAQLPANVTTTWDIIPSGQLPAGATLTVTESIGLNPLISGHEVSMMPAEGFNNSVTFNLSYADGRSDPFGPYTIIGKPAFNNAFSVPSLSLANSAELDMVVPDARGGLLAFGPYATPQAADLAELYVARLDANGIADDNFGTGGVARIQFAESSLTGRVVSSAIPRVQVVKPLGSDWLVGGYVEFEDDEEITWLGAFMFRMQSDGSLSSAFNDYNLEDELVPWVEESATQNLEIGAIFVRNADEILVARNVLTREVDGDIVRLRPSSYRIIKTTALDVPDLDGTLHSDNGDRVRIIAPVPGGSQLMLVSQHLNAVSADSLAIRRFSTEFSWQQDSTLSPGGTLLPLAGAAGDNPISLYPNIEHYVISEAGILWLSGMGDTEGTNKNKYLVGVDLNRNEYNDPIGFYYSNLSTVAAEQRALGLLLGQDNELFELYATGNIVYMRRFFEDGSLDVNFYISGIAEKPISDVFPNTVALLNTVRATGSRVGTRFLAVFDHPLDPGNRHPQELNPYAEESLPAFAQNCVIERYNDISDTYTSFSGAAWVNNNLYVGFNQAGWNVAKLVDGQNWERGEGRGGFYNLFAAETGYDLGAITADAYGGVIMSGTISEGKAIKRATASGAEDTLFAETDFELESTLSFTIQGAGTNRFVLVSLTDQGQDMALWVELYELNTPNVSGEVTLNLLDTFESYVFDDAMWGYILDVVFDDNNNLYVLVNSQEDSLLKFNSNGYLDTTFGTEGVLTLPTSGELNEQIKGMDLVAIDGIESLIFYEEHLIGDFSAAALRKFDVAGANENSFDAAFGDEGIVLFYSHNAPSDNYFTSKQWVVSHENALYVALVNNSGATDFAEIAKLDPNGEYISDWGNLGIAPFSDRAQSASSIHSLSFYEGQLYAIWRDSTTFGVTAFLDSGYVDTGKANAGTTKFSGPLGDEATSLAVTTSGKLYLATDWLGFTESPVRRAVLWGLEYNGNAIDQFGCQEYCEPTDFGTASMYDVIAKRLLPTERNRLLFFANGNNFYDNEPAVLGRFFLNDDETGLNTGHNNPEETVYFTDIFDTGFSTQIEINSVSPFIHDRLLVTGIFDDGFDHDHFIMAFDREGQRIDYFDYEGDDWLWRLDPNNYQNLQTQYPVDAVDTGAGHVWVLMQQTDPDRLWWLGRYGQDGSNPSDGWVGSNNLGMFAEATAIQLATDDTEHVFVLDQLDDDKRARVFKLNSDQEFVNWGTNQGTYYAWVADDLYEPSFMRIAPDGSVFVGGYTTGSKPLLVRISASGHELQRWSGLQLTRADAARVADIAIDTFGNATVLLDSFVNGGWRAQMVRIPNIY